MKPRHAPRSDIPALDLIEEAVHLLRVAPGRLLATYYLGAAPFVLGLLYFWADMSRGAFAYQHASAAAFGVALLYLWLKCWQAVFAQQVLARRAGLPAPVWDRRRVARLVLVQTALQPTALFLLPVAAVATLPFGWVYAGYHNLSVVGDGATANLRDLVRRAWRLAGVAARQNHLLIAVLVLFAHFVFFNLYSAVVLAPFLAKMLLGIESVFTRSMDVFLNTTVLAAVTGLAYLAVNPLVKTVYVLRCFYYESQQTGADLKAELRPLALAAAVIVIFGFGAGTAHANSPVAAPSPVAPLVSPIVPADLDRAIDDVLGRPEYRWRLPRPPAPDAEDNWLTEFFRTVGRMLRNWWRAISQWWDDLLDRFRKWFRRKIPNQPEFDSNADWTSLLYLFAYTLLAITAVILGLMLWRFWRRRQRVPLAVASHAMPAVPDLRDENVLADQLPADDWLARARDLRTAGEHRLALRALFLASLAHLAHRERIRIARAKSNCDYQRELRRRAHAEPPLLEAFSRLVADFERAWYGEHEVTVALLDEFETDVEFLRGVA